MTNFKTLSKDEQRQRQAHALMLCIGLEAHLRNIIRAVKDGAIDKLSEFQQFVNYATPEMRERVMKFLHNEEGE